MANIILLFGIFTESALIISSQAIGVLLVQVLWVVDFLSGALMGNHLIGGTEYMFDTQVSLWLRALSLFHVAIPPLLVFALYRLGYDRRGLPLETLIIWVLLPITFLFTAPELNINWLDSPFGHPQSTFSPLAFTGIMMLAYPIVLFLPTHWCLTRMFRPTEIQA
ncbi:MAG: hypothetical protein AB8C02_13825 [Halioglobus sp.]